MSNTILQKVQFKGGFNKNDTPYAAENWWVNGDRVRYRNGRFEKIGGWVHETVSQSTDPTNLFFTGVGRDIHGWTDLTLNQYFATGTNAKVEIFNGNQIYDVSPYREELSLTNAITTVVTESEVTIRDATHALSVGDFVFVDSQASPVDTITLSGEYTVVEVVDANNYTVDSGTAATGSTSLAGGALEINYLLEVGDINNGDVTGYGGGTYDTAGASGGGYGDPRAGVGGAFLRQWSLDNWGEDLLACVRGGKIYQWDATNGLGVRLQQITNAPTENSLILVAQPTRHLVALGSELEATGVFDPMIIRWASQETLTEWASTVSNTAGEYRIPLGNSIIGVAQTRGEIIIFTDKTVYAMRHVGGNEVFRFELLADNVNAVAQHCATDVNGIVYWMGTDNFYMYDGDVRAMPSTLEEFIFDQDGGGRLNFGQKEKVYCATNNEFNEIIWFYPTEDSLEINRYVIYNYQEGAWYDGTLERTVWLDRNVFSKPYALDSTGKLLIHEEGKDDDGVAMTAFIESGDLDLENGEDMIFIDRFIPDFKLVPNRNAFLTLTVKKYPNQTGIVKGPYTFNNDTDQIKFRARGRQVSIKYEVTTLGADFEVGAPRFGIQIDGER